MAIFTILPLVVNHGFKSYMFQFRFYCFLSLVPLTGDTVMKVPNVNFLTGKFKSIWGERSIFYAKKTNLKY